MSRRGVFLQELTAYQQAQKLRRLPSLLEYLSYVFASGNLLSGPTFELADYLTYMRRQGPWDPKAPKPMPSPVAAGFLRFGKALLCMALHLWLVSKFPIDVVEGKWYAGLRLPAK